MGLVEKKTKKMFLNILSLQEKGWSSMSEPKAEGMHACSFNISD